MFIFGWYEIFKVSAIVHGSCYPMIPHNLDLIIKCYIIEMTMLLIHLGLYDFGGVPLTNEQYWPIF